jgi:hypothetical protein
MRVSFKLHSKVFHEFHPMGGVAASASGDASGLGADPPSEGGAAASSAVASVALSDGESPASATGDSLEPVSARASLSDVDPESMEASFKSAPSEALASPPALEGVGSLEPQPVASIAIPRMDPTDRRVWHLVMPRW